MQVGADGKIGKGMSKDDNEHVIAQMVYDGYIRFDFGYTAYATNAYLKTTHQSSLLLQGGQIPIACDSPIYCSTRFVNLLSEMLSSLSGDCWLISAAVVMHRLRS